MTKTTLLTLLRNRELSGRTGENLYVIKDDEAVFYIGKSEMGGAFRVLEHWDGGIRAREQLREFMQFAVQDGLELTVELLSIADCQTLTNCLDDLDEAEGALITLYCPVFNTASKPNGGAKVPKKYASFWATIDKRLEDRAAMIRDMPIK